MSTRQYRSEQEQDDQRSAGGSVAPGKRARTDALSAPRDVLRFDQSSDYREDRATIDSATPTSSRLSDRQLRRARERNPHWQKQIGFSTSLFGGGDIAGGDFADNVADKQAALGLPVDGIAGPQTVGAAIRGTAGPSDDPFAMHLIGASASTAGSGGKRRPGKRAADKAADKAGDKAVDKAAGEQRLRAEITDIQPTEDGVQLVVGAGANHGVDASWQVKVVGTGVSWSVVEVRPKAIVVVSQRARIDNVIGLHHVELSGVPRAAPAAVAADAADAADAAEPAWWTFED